MTPRKHCPQEEREESRRILSLPGKSKQEPPQRFLLLQLRSEQGKKRLGWIASAPRWMRWGLDEWPPCPASTYSWAGKGNAGGLRRPARPATCRPWGDFSSTSSASVQSRREEGAENWMEKASRALLLRVPVLTSSETPFRPTGGGRLQSSCLPSGSRCQAAAGLLPAVEGA